jgi:zinc protease
VFAVHLALTPRSASEPAGKEGIADFLHRMLLRGTMIRDAAALSAALDALGARIKLVDDPAIPYDDYYTTPEYSFVRLEVPAERWREAMALLGEIVRYPRLAPDDVEAVRKEMIDLQKRQSESTRAVAQELAVRTLYPGHPMSMPVLGTPASIASVTVDDLRAFHREYVSGRRMVLTAVGPVDPAEVLTAARGAFGDLPPGSEPSPVAPPPVTPAGVAADAAVGKGMAQIVLARLFDADPSDEAALAVAGAMLGDRLSFHLREEKGLAYSMSASVTRLAGREKLEVNMGTRQANVDEALLGLRDGIAAFAAAAPDPGQVERAVNALRGRLLMRRMTRINQAYFASLDLMAGREAGDGKKRLDALPRVRPDDVARVAKAYLDPGACATLIVR